MFRFFGVLLLTLALLQNACGQASPDPVLVTIGGRPVQVSEFLYHYRKNPVGLDSVNTPLTLRQYLDLFINYKLKVRAGEALGLDTTQAFREELAGYRAASAQLAMIDRQVTEKLLQEAYTRLKEEVHVAHILLPLAPQAAPADTLRVYQEAAALRQRLLSGEDFAAVARSASKDPTVAQNGGDLGWFTALQFVYPFETAAYHTAKGGISLPVRTNFGYHLIKVLDRRPTQGKVRVGHILFKLPPEASEAAKLQALQKANEAYAELQKGIPFEAVTRLFSDDASTRQNGGLMRAFGPGEMLPEFEQAAFSLKKEGDYTAPFTSPYGYHIIRLVEKLPLLPYEDMKGYLTTKVQSDARSNVSRKATQLKIRQENRYRSNSATTDALLAAADASLPGGRWALPAALAGKTLFSIGNQNVTTDDFAAYLMKNQRVQAGASPRLLMQQWLDTFTDEQNMAYEQAHLEEKNPEFRALVQEYHDGILLFRMLEDSVYQRSVTDSTGLQHFFRQHQKNYTMPARMRGSVLSGPTREAVEQGRQRLARTPYVLGRSLPDVLFAAGQTALTDAQREALFDAVVVMGQHPDYRVVLSGHADSTEPDSVSGGRLRSVVQYLTRQGGVSLLRITEANEGKFKPAANPEASRRVSMKFMTDDRQQAIADLDAGLLLQEGYFMKGENVFVDAADGKTGFVTRQGRMAWVALQKPEAARPKTLAEARGQATADYQQVLESQWIARLKGRFPVVIDEKVFQQLK